MYYQILMHNSPWHKNTIYLKRIIWTVSASMKKIHTRINFFEMNAWKKCFVVDIHEKKIIYMINSSM